MDNTQDNSHTRGGRYELAINSNVSTTYHTASRVASRVDELPTRMLNSCVQSSIPFCCHQAS
jgi:hypothetical protein